ncbi:MBL fold metallo-hydrolase [Rivibacter subsaxonicus]|uniref:MBL fold metallo-hydrolase n=1 Tax=Rivibacter subsaxonicus TaxID=457575 RepID=UPI00102C17AC|nr:MBL fold metallo-hydrolase [Rivibacter subsaxonicus]
MSRRITPVRHRRSPEAVGGRALAALLLPWLLLLLAGLAGRAMAADAVEPPAAVTRIAPGVYMLAGSGGEVEPANRGRIGNAGFIVGPQGVVAIDSGTSYRHGQALLAAIARTTDQPIKLLLLTQTKQEFLFGALAFQERGIPVRMHRLASRLMAARCETCLKNLKRTLGEEEMRGTAIVKPEQEFDESHGLELIGRPLQVIFLGHSSGPGDVALLDAESGVLFAGGLVENRRIPDLLDSDVAGWQKALVALGRQPVRQIVPGHGPVAAPAAIADNARYLGALQARLLELLGAGTALSEVADAATLPAFGDWDQVESTHRRNATILFVRLEREQLFK